MKLAASQIGWAAENDGEVLGILTQHGFSALEIAPTIAVGEAPYDRPERAAAFAQRLQKTHGLAVCSMQSIWYGIAGSLFGAERAFLLEYTKKAILFAAAAGAGNLVFGCPKNRVLPEGKKPEDALPFFRELGDFAAAHGTVLALEANPEIYGTNFVTRTAEAFEMARRVNSPGFKVNLDFGTLVQNGEDVQSLAAHVPMINHVHISEPNLAPVQKRAAHAALARLLKREGYAGYVSVEQKQQPTAAWQAVAAYMAEVFA